MMRAMTNPPHVAIRNPPMAAALLVAGGGALAIAGAWWFELVVGLRPCPLCLEQRWPYYVAIPLAAAVALAAARGAPRRVLGLALLVTAAVLLWGLALAVFHAGVEWHWWAGPQDCAGLPSTGGAAGALLQQMQRTRVVRCDEAAWRFLGLSLAGWNALVALALAGAALFGAAASLRAPATAVRPRRYGSSSVSQYR